MRQSSRTLLLIGGCLLLGLVVVTAWRVGSQPRYEGKSASEWGRLLTRSGSASAAAHDTLGEGGLDALPVCIELLSWEEPRWRKTYRNLWSKLSTRLPLRVWKLLPDPGMVQLDRARIVALEVIAELGPKAKDALPHLLPLTEQGDPFMRGRALAAIGSMHEAARSVLPRLLALMDHPDWVIQPAAIHAVARVGLPDDAAMATLERSLSGPYAYATIRAFGEAGPRAAAAVPVLIEQLEASEQRSIRREAVVALVSIGSTTDTVIEALHRRLADDHWEIRHATVVALVKLDPNRRRLLSRLDEAIEDDDIRVRTVAAEALLDLDGGERDYVIVLCQWLEQPDAAQRWEKLERLVAFVPRIDLALPGIVRALRDENERVRARAAELLGGMGSEAAVALPALQAAAADDQLMVREAVAGALRRLEEVDNNGADGGEAIAQDP